MESHFSGRHGKMSKENVDLSQVVRRAMWKGKSQERAVFGCPALWGGGGGEDLREGGRLAGCTDGRGGLQAEVAVSAGLSKNGAAHVVFWG